jgi:hypothetical protein
MSDQLEQENKKFFLFRFISIRPSKKFKYRASIPQNSESDMRLFLAPICHFPLIQPFQ